MNGESVDIILAVDWPDEPTAVVGFDELPTRVVALPALPDEAADTQHRRDLQLFFVGGR